MKKRIITLLAVLALLVTCAVLTVNAADPVTPRSYYESESWECPSCKAKGNAVNWTVWGTDYDGDGEDDYTLTAGETCAHYFLPAAGSSSSTRGITGTGNIVIVASGVNGTAVKHTMLDTCNKRFMYIEENQNVWIIGNNATIETACEGGEVGGAFYVNKGTLTLMGKLTIQKNADSTSVPGNGGMIYGIGGATINIHDGVTINGTSIGSSSVGGAIYVTGSRVNMSGGNIVANTGFTGQQGALAGVYSASVFNMTGGTMTNPNTKTGVRVQNADFYLQGGEVRAANLNDGAAFQIVRTSTTSQQSTLLLAGDGTVSNLDGGVNANNVKLVALSSNSSWAIGRLLIDNNWSGHANVNYNNKAATAGSSYYSGSIKCVPWDAEKETFGTAAGGHKGYLVSGYHTNKMGLYGISGYVLGMRCRVMKYEDGAETTMKWYITPETGYASYTGSQYYVKLEVNYNVELPKNQNRKLDLNGKNLTGVTLNGGSLAVFDTKATTTAASSATVKGDVKSVCQAPNGKTYITSEGKVYEVAVEAAINGVSVRPSANGIYYTAQMGTVTAPAGVADLLSIGVAVSLDENAKTLATTAWTKSEAGVSTSNSILVKNIIKDGDVRDVSNVNTAIYARPCVTYNDELVYMGDAKDYSLTGVMELMNDNHTVLEGAGGLPAAKEFYAKWKADCSWNFANLETA